MPFIKYESPVFWKPVNAMGVSAQIDGIIDNAPIKINLYWSGMLLATNKEIDESLMKRQAAQFMKTFMPAHNTSPFHFECDGKNFKKIVDPGWMPGSN